MYRESTTSLRTTASRKGKAVRAMVEEFLKEVGDMGERCPTYEELDRARANLYKLQDVTRVDHIRSVDELVAQIPVEFSAACRALEAAEAFVIAAAGGSVDDVSAALDRNFELLNSVDRDGHTALHAASACDCHAVVELLLSKGAKVNSQDYQGYTPLHWAVESGAIASIGVLLGAGADSGIRTNSRKLPTDLMGHLKPKVATHVGKLLGCERPDVAALAFALARGDLAPAVPGAGGGAGGSGPAAAHSGNSGGVLHSGISGGAGGGVGLGRGIAMSGSVGGSNRARHHHSPVYTGALDSSPPQYRRPHPPAGHAPAPAEYSSDDFEGDSDGGSAESNRTGVRAPYRSRGSGGAPQAAVSLVSVADEHTPTAVESKLFSPKKRNK